MVSGASIISGVGEGAALGCGEAVLRTTAEFSLATSGAIRFSEPGATCSSLLFLLGPLLRMFAVAVDCTPKLTHLNYYSLIHSNKEVYAISKTDFPSGV
jgi:hypothetical protein